MTHSQVRAQFPILNQLIRGKPLVYLDNAATTQKPQAVIDRVHQFYETENANIHRGVHFLSEQATQSFEKVREKTRAWINAASAREIIFTRGTTDAINLVAQSFGRLKIQAGDRVLISEMEHHSNIVPWQLMCEHVGAQWDVIRMTDEGELDLADFEAKLTPYTRIVAITHVSNALGTVNPIKKMIAAAHERKIPVLIDGAQGIVHAKVDVRDLDCDFYVFSSHKLYGPTGVGVLYGKSEWLNTMPPYQGGGDMIQSVTFHKTTYNVIPYKFEAGTPPIAEVLGFGAALQFLEKIGMEFIQQHEKGLIQEAVKMLKGISGVRLVGEAKERAGAVSFVMEGVHPHDIGTIVDQEGVAIRVGHHCAQPVMERLKVPATARASFAVYNTIEEVHALGRALENVREIFK